MKGAGLAFGGMTPQQGKLRFEHLFEAMRNGYVPAGWVDRYVDERTCRLRLETLSYDEKHGVFAPRLVGYPDGAPLLDPVFVVLEDPMRFPLYPRAQELGYAFFPADAVAPWLEQSGLEISVRIQGHIGVMRRKGGKPIPPSIMARIIDREGMPYDDILEWTLLPLSFPLLRAYTRALEKLGGKEDWEWAQSEVVHRLHAGGHHAYHLRFLMYLEARRRGASAKAKAKIFRIAEPLLDTE